MMLIHDASGAVAVVSAESVKMAGVERVSVHVSRLAHCPDVFFVEFSRAGSVGNLVVPLGRSEAEALRDELGEALSGRITEAPDVS